MHIFGIFSVSRALDRIRSICKDSLSLAHILGDSTDGRAAASYPGDPGFKNSRLHAAACLISVSATDPADNE